MDGEKRVERNEYRHTQEPVKTESRETERKRCAKSEKRIDNKQAELEQE